jgi:hypothetical protein
MQTGHRQMPDQVTTGASYTAAGGTFVIGAFGVSEWAAIGGLLFAAATWGLNYWVQTRRLKMEEREHQARMALMHKGDK